MVRDHGPQIKDAAVYEALLRQGASPEKAARIANAKAAGTLRHDSTRLEDRTVPHLREEAKRIGITGTSRMRKSALVDAIRNHR